ncbi:hypothetical protein MBUL_03178 [Methylobacterium bullatum]|uniref:Uncharacterized protein n=1 Tax=Methylobacterium bullatum TaxID=570505 RepID=A0A679J339_9HYPH|nr:hypothetical protein MBUL_03178 [Methylobacterium bullatum]
MRPTRIIRDEWEVEQRLAELGTNKAEMIEIARKASAARADSTEDDPRSGGGLLSWIYGTRALRKTFRPKGWKRNSADNIPSVVNRETGIKFIFQNADSAADALRDPKAISDKKKASERLVAAAQMSFDFPEAEREDEEFIDIPSTAFYYFVAMTDNGDLISELSSPRAIEGGQFNGFHERIFIINPGDVERIDVMDDADDDQLPDFDVIVTSK